MIDVESGWQKCGLDAEVEVAVIEARAAETTLTK